MTRMSFESKYSEPCFLPVLSDPKHSKINMGGDGQ
jgi:hypothetical protein